MAFPTRPLTVTLFAALALSAPAGTGSLAQLSMTPSTGPTASPPTRIVNGVYRFQGRGSAVGIVIGDTSVVLIDAGAAEDTTALLRAIASLTRLPVRHVVNTHFHADHVGGDRAFLARGAAVLASEATAEMLRRERELLIASAPKEIETLEGMKLSLWPSEPSDPKGKATKSTVTGIIDRMIATWRVNLGRARTLDPARQPYPTATFHARRTLEIAGRRLVLDAPVPRAHVKGDIVVELPAEKVLFVGDLWSPGWLPWADVRCGGGSLAGELRALRALTAKYGDDPSWTVVPGHGDLSGLAALHEGTSVAETVRRNVLASKQAGRSRAAAVRAIPQATLRGYRDPLRFTWLVYDEAEADSVAKPTRAASGR